MITDKVPGYCYQNLTLFHAVLARVGFTVTKHLSKVMMTPRDEVDHEQIAQNPYSHMALQVIIEDKGYLVDPGFSNECLRFPLPLTPGIHALATDTYLLAEMDDCWRLNSMRYDPEGNSSWYSLYRFDKQAAGVTQINKAHHDLYHIT